MQILQLKRCLANAGVLTRSNTCVRQIKAGVPRADIRVPQRTASGIAFELRQLKLNPTSRWKKAEVGLLRKEAKTGKPPWKITILGRSPLAIRNKMIRLHLWQPKCRNQKPWMRTEMNRLKRLVISCGYTARQAVTNGYFPGRSIHSVAQQMRRCGWKRI